MSDDVFGVSLRMFLPDDSTRLYLLAAGVNCDAAIGGFDGTRLVGAIGLKTSQASVFDTLTFRVFRQELGIVAAIRTRTALGLLDRPLAPGAMRIEFVAVDESMRGHGVGSCMLDTTSTVACSANVDRLELNVEQENTGAQRLYQRHGFQIVPNLRESTIRRTLAPQNDLRTMKELSCVIS